MMSYKTYAQGRMVAILAAIAILVLGAYVIATPSDSFASVLGDLATLIGIFFIAYTLAMMRQANDLAAITSIRSILSEDTANKSRRYIHAEFEVHLASAAQHVFGPDCVEKGCLNPNWILSNILREDHLKELEFNKALNAIPSGIGLLSSLDAAERVLMDFDLIAIPYCERNDSVNVAAKAWTPVLKATSKKLLPFVLLKANLRGAEYYYRRHYMTLLKEICALDEFRELWKMKDTALDNYVLP